VLAPPRRPGDRHLRLAGRARPPRRRCARCGLGVGPAGLHRTHRAAVGRYCMKRYRQTLTGYAFLGPSLIGVVGFLLVPVVVVVAISLYRWDLVSPARWTGPDKEPATPRSWPHRLARATPATQRPRPRPGTASELPPHEPGTQRQ
jgi:hypothetical protein